jgi:hypothetical protein
MLSALPADCSMFGRSASGTDMTVVMLFGPQVLRGVRLHRVPSICVKAGRRGGLDGAGGRRRADDSQSIWSFMTLRARAVGYANHHRGQDKTNRRYGVWGDAS